MSHELIDEIFDEDGIIKQFKGNYVPRPSQIKATKMLYDAIEEEKHGVIEGPCGFGKTFSYLVPAALKIAEDKANKAVVSTSGISLSEQLIYQDLPVIAQIIEEATGFLPKFGLLKGKGNFLCQRKYKESADFITEPLAGRRLQEWFKKTHSGDFSELDFTVSYQDLSQIACMTEGECMGQKCESFSDCFYQKHKKEAWKADIIVTNYHLLFSNWKIGGGLLPQYNILIMDEAHEAAQIFRDFAAEEFSSSQVTWAKNKIHKLLQKTPILSSGISALESGEYHFHDKMTQLSIELQILEKNMGFLFEKFETYKLVTVEMEINNEIACFKAADECIPYLTAIIDHMEEMAESCPAIVNDIYAVQNAASRALEKVETIKMYFQERKIPDLHKRYVYYIEKTESQVKLAKKHIKVNDIICRAFFENKNISSAILTSATLSVAGTFDYIKSELGLDLLEEKEVVEYIGDSPFDLTKQQLWYMPTSCVNGNSKEYAESVDAIVNEIVDAVGGGILFLCTSNTNMKNIYDIVRMNDTVVMNEITVLRQGLAPNKQISEHFKQDVDSILVATRSFFTGIDVPGEALRCVVIDKLPFPVPTEPVMATLSKEEGAFAKYSIPIMVMTLKQAIGRGVRSIDDKCVIAFMDRRIKTAKYVSKIMSSFPYEKTPTKDPFDVKLFLEQEKE